MINFPSARIRFRERGRARSLPDLPSDGLRIICRSISRRIMFGFPGRRDWRHDPISIQLTERRIFICDFCSGVRWEEASLLRSPRLGIEPPFLRVRCSRIFSSRDLSRSREFMAPNAVD